MLTIEASNKTEIKLKQPKPDKLTKALKLEQKQTEAS